MYLNLLPHHLQPPKMEERSSARGYEEALRCRFSLPINKTTLNVVYEWNRKSPKERHRIYRSCSFCSCEFPPVHPKRDKDELQCVPIQTWTREQKPQTKTNKQCRESVPGTHPGWVELWIIINWKIGCPNPGSDIQTLLGFWARPLSLYAQIPYKRHMRGTSVLYCTSVYV